MSSIIDPYGSNYLQTEPDKTEDPYLIAKPFKRATLSRPSRSIMMEGHPVLSNNREVYRRRRISRLERSGSIGNAVTAGTGDSLSSIKNLSSNQADVIPSKLNLTFQAASLNRRTQYGNRLSQ
jgi:hypothetical protein